MILAIIFYGLFTPTAWILRLRGHDPMARMLDASLKTYCINRKKSPNQHGEPLLVLELMRDLWLFMS